MKISSEAKVGVIGIATIAILIWGINYLKGKNILSSTYTLHAFYNHAGGLESTAPVLMNGVKIGFVNEVQLLPGEIPPIKTVLSIDKAYPIRKDSRAELYSADLLGTKAIRISSSENERYFKDNDTILTSVKPDLLTALQAQIIPVMQQINTLAVSLDTLAHRLDTLLGSETTRETMQHLSSISKSLKTSLDTGGALDQSFRNMESFSAMLKAQQDEMASLIRHLNSISQSVDSSGIDQLAEKLLSVTNQFDILLEHINSGEGNAGKLIYSDSLYLNMEILISDLDKLVRDLNENPQDYVQISLFGKSKKDNQ
ncbi:MAG: MCE family protein [Bacteroidales bacterium]|nr:MCE family protein [Bacteroidales bacterium]